MTTYQKLTGKVTITGGKPASQNPSGLLLQAYISTTPEQQLWLGSARVAADGNFILLANTDSTASDNMVIHVYNNETLIKQFPLEGVKEDLEIEIAAAEYDTAVPDDVMGKEHADYFVIRGAVVLGNASVAAVPLDTNNWQLVLQKALFRESIAIAGTQIDAFGNFEFKIPYRLLYENTTTKEFNAIPKLQIALERNEITSPVALSSWIDLDVQEQFVTVTMDTPSQYSDFYREYDYTTQVIAEVSGFGEAVFNGFVTEGEQPEINLLKATAGIDPVSVGNRIAAAKMASNYALNAELMYALIRKGYPTMEAIATLNAESILAIVQEAKDQWVINGETSTSTLLEKIDLARVNMATEELTSDGVSLRTLLLAMVNDADVVAAFLNMYLNNDSEDMPAFWTAVAANSSIGTTNAKRFQDGLQVMAVVGMQPEMIQFIMAKDLPADVSEYLKQSQTDWYKDIDDVCEEHLKLCVPDGIRNGVSQEDYTNIEVKQAYSEKIFNIVSELYTVSRIKDMLTTDTDFMENFGKATEIKAFLNANPEFDFRTSRIWDVAPEVDEDTRKELQALQNMTRLTSGNTNMLRALAIDKLYSSSKVVAKGQDYIIDLLSHEQPEQYIAAAKDVFNKAKLVDAHIKQSYVQILPGNFIDKVTTDWAATIWTTQGEPGTEYSYPDLETLFGDMDFCACSDCSSMYSPSAYFTDVFNFIKTKVMSNAGAELVRRRPDLKHIDLSCKNANTIMPYIDLVNEILELQILKDISMQDGPDKGMMVPNSFQTTATAEELAAYPEHTYNIVDSSGSVPVKTPATYNNYVKVYDDRLNKAIFPNTLPFNLATDESRVFLKHLGHARKDLMQLFKSTTFDTVWNNTEVNAYTAAAEALEINSQVADIITKNVSNDIWKYYGFAAENTWYDTLRTDLETLLHNIQVEYKTFLEILTTDFLNPVVPAIDSRAFAITSKPGAQADTCKLEELMLEFNVTPGDNTTQIKDKKVAFFDKLHRFVRLMNATKWTVYQLDTVLRSLDAEDITISELIHVALAKQWAEQYSLAPEYLCALWGGIDTVRYMNMDNETQPEYPSAYDRLFRNKGVTNPTDPNFEDHTAISGTIQDNLGTIIAAFNTTEEDIKMAIGSNLNVNTTLELLSRIQQRVLLYRLTGYTSLTELYYNLQLTFNLSFNDATPAAAIASFRKFREAKTFADKCVLKTDELQFLLQHRDSGNKFIVDDANIQAFYEQLRTELKQVLGDAKLTDNTDEALAMKDRLEKVTIQKFTAAFATDQNYTKALLSGLIIPLTSTKTLLEILVSDTFINSTVAITATGFITGLIAFDELYRTYHLFSKASLITTKLLLGSELSVLLQQTHAPLGVFNINDLPVATFQTGQDLVDGFTNLNNWIELRDTLRLTDKQLIGILKEITTGADNNQLLQMLVNTLLWSADDLVYLLGEGITNKGILKYTFSPAVTNTHDYRKASLLLQADKIMRAIKKTGLSARALHESLLPQIETEQSVVVRKAAKAKYEISEWYGVVKPLQDVLRRSQRDALVAYLLVNPAIVLQDSTMKLKNENDLFAYLLIDVEMESCMKTSRLKLGISSLQLFMDRAILNLERYYKIIRDPNTGVITSSTIEPITLTEDNISQWQSWRKWYRIWEANRKIFMYPENWIEPELRDKKTGLFKELESHLLQDEVTDARVEEGFRTYLDGLNEIARLEPVSAYHQTSYGKDILHVFGRTDSDPQRYYYRNREDNEWSEWQRVSVDIKSQHVVPVMWNNKMYLFWLTFQKKKPSTSNNTDTSLSVTDRPGATVGNGKPSMDSKADRFADPKKAREFAYTGNNWTEIMTNPYANAGTAIMNDADNDRYSIWNITLNWSQFQDGKWLSHDLSKDIMDIDLAKIQINGNAKSSITDNVQAADIIYKLTNNGSITIEEFFRKRIFLFTPFDLTQDTEDGIAFNLLFAPGLNEVGTGLHTFLWKGDNSRDPFVLRDSDRGHSMLAPSGTRFNNMKFVQDKAQGAGFKKDAAYSHNNSGYFTYSYLTYYPAQASVKVYGSPVQILKQSPTPFRLTACAATTTDTMFDPVNKRFFYEDENNTFLVEDTSGTLTAYFDPKLINAGKYISLDNVTRFSAANFSATATKSGAISNTPALGQSKTAEKGYKFQTFYHAQAPKLTAALNRGGIDNLLTLANQSQSDTMNFVSKYAPTVKVMSPYPKNNMQFDFADPFSMYNWELFFHAPMLIAQQLSNNQQFAEAQKWYHYIFNPTSTTGNGVQRYWKFQKFYEISGTPIQTINDLLISIHNNNPDAVAQVKKWEKDPFNPHLIARMRVLAYMKNVLMKYLDNLIAWADNLFKRDTIESINEATQLYILAANLLGERPRQIPARVKRTDLTFQELADDGLDALSNAMVAIESFLAPNQAPGVNIYQTDAEKGEERKEEGNIPVQTFYFCLPKNDKLLSYWDTLADRLFKIRNCMNIDGVTRQLALYEPPIDPALLVRAKAMGLSTESLLNDIYGKGRPFYRFSYMVQKTNELLGDVKSLGGSMLSALEKKDAEALSLLRSGQEYDLLEKVKEIKTQQIAEASSNLDNLHLAKSNTQIRYDFYSSRPFMNANEQKHLDKMQSAMTFQIVQGVLQTTGGILSALPEFHAQGIASGGSFGGLQLANVMYAASAAAGIKVGIDNSKGAMAATTGGYERRRDDWQMQAATAAKELQQLDQQILAAEIRLDIANKELRNHELQMDHNIAVDNYMRSKFTNVDLYSWMIAQLATTYFQSYQMAYDLAKQADVCFQSELPAGKYPTGGFIKYGYWDSLKKGLLSGEKLQMDLRKMELAYMESNERELELTKHVSLAMFSPASIIQLRESGNCTIDIPEVLFDLDYPGHYMRRIKSVSISVPCVAGPYTTISCELRQVNSQYRKSASTAGNYTDSDKYVSTTSNSVVATSSAQNDSGVFELNFRDERYLPFEGTGAISEWSITFPDTYRQFDYDTINDIILHIKYTARSGGETLKTKAEENIGTTLAAIGTNNVLHRYFSARHEFSNNWFAYAKNFEHNSYARLQMSMTQDNFPFFTKGKTITVKQIGVSMNGTSSLSEDYTVSITYTAANGYKTVSKTFDSNNKYTNTFDLSTNPIVFASNAKLLQIAVTNSDGNPVNAADLLNDLYVVLDYTIASPGPDTEEDDVAQRDIALDSDGLVGWWKADNIENTVVSGKVNVIKDESGENKDFIPLGTSTSPELILEDSIPALHFFEDKMFNGTNGDTIGDVESFTIFIVGKSGFGRGMNNYSFIKNGNSISFLFDKVGTSWPTVFTTTEDKSIAILTVDQMASTPSIKTYDLDGNMASQSLISGYGMASTNGIGLTMGAMAHDWTGYINGLFYEAIIYNRILNQEELVKVLSYLKSKYPFLNA
ncbi:hypothetical protein D3C71_29750 [compost metagenome]